MAVKPISVNFQVGGVSDILKALQTIEQATSRASKSQAQQANYMANLGKQVANQQARDASAWHRRRLAIVAKSNDMERKTENDHQKNLTNIRVRTMEKDQKAMESAKSYVQNVQRRHFAQKQTDEKRQADNLLNIRLAHYRKNQQVEASQQKNLQDIRYRTMLADQRQQEKHADHIKRLNERTAQQASKRLQEQRMESVNNKANFIGAIGGGAVRGVGQALGMAGKVAGGLLALGGGFSAADAVKGGLSARGTALDIQLQSQGAVTKDDVMKKATGISNSTGFSEDELAKAASTYGAKSGNYTAGLESLDYMAKAALATGAKLEDIATTMGNAHYSFGSAEGAKQFIGSMGGIGRTEGIDLADFGQYGVRLSGATNRYADKQGAITDIIIGAQMAHKGGGINAAESSIGASQFGTDIFKHEEGAAYIAGGKDKVFTESGELRNQMDIVRAIIDKNSVNSYRNSVDVFQERGRRVVSGGETFYKEGRATVKTGTEAEKHAAGMKAFDEWVSKLRGSVLNEGQIGSDAATRKNGEDVKINIAMESLKNAIAEQLIPALVQMSEKLKEMIPGLVKVLGTLLELVKAAIEHPYLATGAIMAGGAVQGAAAGALQQGIGMAGTAGMSAIKKMIGGAAVTAVAEGTASAVGGGVAAAGVAGLASGGGIAAAVAAAAPIIIPLAIAALVAAGGYAIWSHFKGTGDEAKKVDDEANAAMGMSGSKGSQMEALQNALAHAKDNRMGDTAAWLFGDGEKQAAQDKQIADMQEKYDELKKELDGTATAARGLTEALDEAKRTASSLPHASR